MFFLIPAFWFLIAFVLAGLECEIEGPDGWASGLPTCRVENRWVTLVLRPFFGGRPITLYHCYMFSLVVLLCHAGYAQGMPFSWTGEWRIISALFLLCLTWDFLWFMLNPAYGPENFRREKVEWHKHRPWVLGLFPVDYAIGFVLSLAFAVLGWISDEALIFDVFNGVVGYGVWGFLLGIAADAFAPWYRRWRAKKKPERAYRTPEDSPPRVLVDSP